MINIDRDKAEFKAILSGQLINFGFQQDRKGFFEWCIHNGYMSFINYRDSEGEAPFFVYKVLKPMRFQMEHSQYKEYPDWGIDVRACTGPILVDITYHPYGWGKYYEEL